MRALIEKLATLYPDNVSSRRILLYANISTGSLPFEPAAEDTWVGIYGKLKNQRDLLINLFKEIMKDLDEEGQRFFQERIDALEKELEQSPSQPVDPSLFNIYSVFGDEFAFINRSKIRSEFKRMITGDIPKNTLVIEGESGSGLTHIHLYIAEILYRCKKYELVQVLWESVMGKNRFTEGADLAKVISQQLNLNYSEEEGTQGALLKNTPFFTKLKGIYKADDPQSKIPIICLDGMSRISNPSINRFIGELLHEAITSKAFCVILTISDDSLMKEDWPHRLQRMTTFQLAPFKREEVKEFVKKVYAKHHETVDMGYNPDSFSEAWMDKNANNMTFEEDTLNVKDIGEACTEWYKEFCSEIKKQLNGA